MFGHRSKSHGKSYIYYVCATAYRQGRQSCSGHSIPGAKIEGAVLRNITAFILKRRNIEELVSMVNEELVVSSHDAYRRLSLLEQEREEVDRRLNRLYDALETGQLELNDLAPRIREQRSKKDELLKAETEARYSLDRETAQRLDTKQVMAYVKDLGRILELGTSEERKELLRSFVKSVAWNEPEVIVEYVLPVPPAKLNLNPEDVAHFEHVGEPCGIRTHDTRIKSPVLYR